MPCPRRVPGCNCGAAYCLDRREKRALDLLLAHGGARYGTMYKSMKVLATLGLAKAVKHQGVKGPGRWTWQPTECARLGAITH